MHEIFDIEHKEVFHVTCQPCVANKIKKSMKLDFRLKKKLLSLFHQFKFSYIFSIDMKETCIIVSLIKKNYLLVIDRTKMEQFCEIFYVTSVIIYKYV